MLVCEKTVFLSDKKGLIVFQNFLLSKTFFISKDSQYFLLSLLYNLLQKFLCFLYSLRSVWVLLLRYFVSSWDLCVIAFLRVFVMYGAWLASRSFFLNGTCLFCTSMKVVSNDSYLEIPYLIFLLKLFLNLVRSKYL